MIDWTEQIIESLAAGEQIVIRGFGSFGPRRYASYMRSDHLTKELLEVPERILPFFKIARDLRCAIHGEPRGKVPSELTPLWPALVAGGWVRAGRIGAFRIRRVPASEGRNPQTGEPLRLEPRTFLSFAPSRSLVRAMNDEAPLEVASASDVAGEIERNAGAELRRDPMRSLFPGDAPRADVSAIEAKLSTRLPGLLRDFLDAVPIRALPDGWFCLPSHFEEGPDMLEEYLRHEGPFATPAGSILFRTVPEADRTGEASWFQEDRVSTHVNGALVEARPVDEYFRAALLEAQLRASLGARRLHPETFDDVAAYQLEMGTILRVEDWL